MTTPSEVQQILAQRRERDILHHYVKAVHTMSSEPITIVKVAKEEEEKEVEDKEDSINLYHNKEEVLADYLEQVLEDEEDEDYVEEGEEEGEEVVEEEEEEGDSDSSDDSFICEEIEYDDKEDELEKIEKELAHKEKIVKLVTYSLDADGKLVKKSKLYSQHHA